MQEQLNKQMRGRSNDVQLMACGHSRVQPMKAFGVNEWDSPSRGTKQNEFNNTLHNKRISEADAL